MREKFFEQTYKQIKLNVEPQSLGKKCLLWYVIMMALKVKTGEDSEKLDWEPDSPEFTRRLLNNWLVKFDCTGEREKLGNIPPLALAPPVRCIGADSARQYGSLDDVVPVPFLICSRV